MIKHPTRGQRSATLIIAVAMISMLYAWPLPAMLIMLSAGVYAAMLRIIAGLFVSGAISRLIMVPMDISAALFASWLVPGTLKAIYGDVLFSVPVTWGIATIAMIAIAYAGGLQLALQWPALQWSWPKRNRKKNTYQAVYERVLAEELRRYES